MSPRPAALSRRTFLAGTLSAAAGVLVPCSAPAGEAAVDPNRFVLLSDPHISRRARRVAEGRRGLFAGREGRDGALHRREHARDFIEARCEILALQPRPAGVILGGDYAFLRGLPADYAVVDELFQPFRSAGLPMHLILGNHDCRASFWAALPHLRPRGESPVPGRQVAIVESPRVNWFLLDSLHQTNELPGLLGRTQLAWLARELDARRDRPALVVAHHHLEPGCPTEGLLDTAALMEVLLPRANVQAYIHGHRHRWELVHWQRLPVVKIPTTAWVFDQSQPQGWVDAHARDDGVAFTLHALDRSHPARGQTFDLRWQ